MKTAGILSFLCFLIFLGSCRKDEDFLRDPSAKLSFSTDSIAFDTVFTTIGTTTKNFRIYNPHNDPIKISTIRLRDGQQSAFRINVDGIASTNVHDVEILPGDSLYIFVEATINPRDQDNPFFVEDAIQFETNGNLQEVKLLAYGQDAYYIIADTRIAGLPPFKVAVGEGVDTTWTNKRPIVVYGYAVVDSSATLRISEGTQIYFHQGAGLWVYQDGTIKVNGTIDQPVVFQGDRLEAAYANIPGQWDRIWINDGNMDNEFNHAIIKNAFIGLQAELFPFKEPVPPIVAGLEINNTLIQNCSAFGIYSSFFNMSVDNLLISNCGQYNLAVVGGGNYVFRHATLVNYFNADSRESPLLFIKDSKTLDTPRVHFYNSIIDGANEDEFDFELGAGGAIDFLFSNSLLKTSKDISDPAHYQNVVKNPVHIFEDIGSNNFHLGSGSPAIDVGDISIGNAVPQDLDGNSRTLDGQPDAGVYEFQ